jgi:hypothetical protein
MFFDGDSSSGVSGDLESATAVATNMEGIWGMGSTVSSYATSSSIGLGAPGGAGKGEKTELTARRALADRIEDNLGEMLTRTAAILEDNRREVLALAHALEMHKTLTGEDVVAVLEGRPGPLIDGSIYTDDRLISELESYHRAVLDAHRNHSKLGLTLPGRARTGEVSALGSEIWRRPEPVGKSAENGSTPKPES